MGKLVQKLEFYVFLKNIIEKLAHFACHKPYVQSVMQQLEKENIEH